MALLYQWSTCLHQSNAKKPRLNPNTQRDQVRAYCFREKENKNTEKKIIKPVREDLAEYCLNVISTVIPDSLLFPEDIRNKNCLGECHHTQRINLILDLIKLFSKNRDFEHLKIHLLRKVSFGLVMAILFCCFAAFC